jgi:hypothetical protein
MGWRGAVPKVAMTRHEEEPCTTCGRVRRLTLDREGGRGRVCQDCAAIIKQSRGGQTLDDYIQWIRRQPKERTR